MKKARNRILLVLVLTACIALMLPGLCASAENIGSYPVGVEMGWIQFYSSSLPIINCVPYSGGLPSDVEMYWDADGVYITGVPDTAGSYIAEYMVFTEEGASYANVSFTVTEQPVSRDMVITKSPTGERVEVGGSAKFVARAQNAERIVWRIVSNDTTNTVQASEASSVFPGLQVGGLGTETLVLSGIPQSMDGWRVEAQFWSGNKHAESMGAEITIVDSQGNPVRNRAVVTTPTPAPQFNFPTNQPTVPSVGNNDMPVDSGARTANISIQPQSAQLMPGDSYTLSVIATSPNNGALSYQWYSAATNNRSAALPISGANDASYTVNQTDGTAYYWVAVWNTRDGARSQAVYSEAAEVRIVTPATPTPVPTPTPTLPPTPAPRSSTPSNISFQLILFGIIGVLALIALIGVVIYLRADAKQKAIEEEEENRRDSQ